MRGKKSIQDIGPYLVDESHIGVLDGRTKGIVMDCVHDLDRNKPRVKVIRTSNIDFFAGDSTVAVFRIKRYNVA